MNRSSARSDPQRLTKEIVSYLPEATCVSLEGAAASTVFVTTKTYFRRDFFFFFFFFKAEMRNIDLFVTNIISSRQKFR